MKTGERYSNDQNKNIYDHNRYWCSSVVWRGKKQVETTEVTTEEMTTEVSATTEALEMVALKDAEIGDIVQWEPTNRMVIRRQKIRSAGMCWKGWGCYAAHIP